MNPIKAVVWSTRALIDLRDIGDYYAEHSPRAAQKIIDAIFACENLLLGRAYVEWPKQEVLRRDRDYRYMVCGNYKIIHYRQGTTVRIVTVFDARQDPERLKL